MICPYIVLILQTWTHPSCYGRRGWYDLPSRDCGAVRENAARYMLLPVKLMSQVILVILMLYHRISNCSSGMESQNR